MFFFHLSLEYENLEALPVDAVPDVDQHSWNLYVEHQELLDLCVDLGSSERYVAGAHSWER